MNHFAIKVKRAYVSKLQPARGSILVYVLCVMAILSMLGIYGLKVSMSDRVISDSVLQDKKAYYIAFSGIKTAKYKYMKGEIELGEVIVEKIDDGHFEAELVNLEVAQGDTEHESEHESEHEIEILSRGYYKDAMHVTKESFKLRLTHSQGGEKGKNY